MKKICLIAAMGFFSFSATAQNSIEFTAGIGFTGANLDKVVEEDEVDGTDLLDWNQMNSGFCAQFVHAKNEKIGFGGEVMYQYLYWYQVKVPYGSSDITREYDVTAMRLTPFIRLSPQDNLNVDFGLELNFIDGLSPGLLAALNYYAVVGDGIYIPFKLRFDFFNYIVFTPTVSLQVGLRFDIKGKE